MAAIVPAQRPMAGVNSEIQAAGVSVIASFGGVLGGFIVNPRNSADQGIVTPETLYVDPTGPATLVPSPTTVAVEPGGSFEIPPETTGPVWVNARTAGHRFTAVILQVPTPFPPTPTNGDFPPSGPTGLTKVIPSYLYEEYFDDDDLQAFVASYNAQAQDYVDTFNAMNLPIYTSDEISGTLLDWVAAGLYGLTRPALASGKPRLVGPLDTYEFNTMRLNDSSVIEADVVTTTDDIFKRILTWHLFKGDGKVFDVRWLKRRVARFLFGINGTAPNIDQTYQISVTFGVGGEVAIRFVDQITTLIGGAIFGGFLLNDARFDETLTTSEQLTPLPNRVIFKEALDSGALELPFQQTWDVTI